MNEMENRKKVEMLLSFVKDDTDNRWLDLEFDAFVEAMRTTNNVDSLMILGFSIGELRHAMPESAEIFVKVAQARLLHEDTSEVVAETKGRRL